MSLTTSTLSLSPLLCPLSSLPLPSPPPLLLLKYYQVATANDQLAHNRSVPQTSEELDHAHPNPHRHHPLRSQQQQQQQQPGEAGPPRRRKFSLDSRAISELKVIYKHVSVHFSFALLSYCVCVSFVCSATTATVEVAWRGWSSQEKEV